MHIVFNHRTVAEKRQHLKDITALALLPPFTIFMRQLLDVCISLYSIEYILSDFGAKGGRGGGGLKIPLAEYIYL